LESARHAAQDEIVWAVGRREKIWVGSTQFNKVGVSHTVASESILIVRKASLAIHSPRKARGSPGFALRKPGRA
jgi:hypothetical protein